MFFFLEENEHLDSEYWYFIDDFIIYVIFFFQKN